MSSLKSISRRQGRWNENPSERSPSANLRANEQKLDIRPNPWASGHFITKPVRRTWGMVNSVVVQGKIISLPGEIRQSRRLMERLETSAAMLSVKTPEVSRGREPASSGERTKDSGAEL